jgi:DNA-binding response OmpR family regulator
MGKQDRKMAILIFEADFERGDFLFRALRLDNIALHWVVSAQDAEQTLRHEPIGLSIIDLTSLDMSLSRRLDMLYRLRQAKPTAPMLVIVRDRRELNTLADCAEAVEAAAELSVSRLRRLAHQLLEQRYDEACHNLAAGDLRLDLRLRQAFIGARPVTLTPREYAVLRVLAGRAGNVVTRQELLDQAYHWDEEIESNALEVHVSNLRKKLGKERIHTRRGVGYRLQ